MEKRTGLTGMRTCPHCRATLREENFASHLERVHHIGTAAGLHKTAVKPSYMIGASVAVAILVAVIIVLQNRSQTRTPRTTAPSDAVATSAGTRVGDVAPDFQLVDVNGARVTRSTLVAGKPGLIFFTATWCLPCVEGLRDLAKFEAEVGRSPFRVLVAFVDPRETNDDLRSYQQRFGFPSHWRYALDRDQMVVRYGIRFLDTKFVLDAAGIIRFADVYPANYETWRRALATVGIAPKTP